MKLNTKTKPSPSEGDKRIESSFLLIPRCINNEWRWLETVSWEQVYAPEGAAECLAEFLAPGIDGEPPTVCFTGWCSWHDYRWCD